MSILDLLAKVQDEAPFEVFQGQFAYWRGLSGRRYVHSIKQIADLDAYPGGIAVLVNADGKALHVLSISEGASAFARESGATTAHVHLPAPEAAQAACDDLRAALRGRRAGRGVRLAA